MIFGMMADDCTDADNEGILHAKFCHLTYGLGGRCNCGGYRAPNNLDEDKLQDAIKFVSEWRWDDREFRIPPGPFGAQLAHSIDVLLENAIYE